MSCDGLHCAGCPGGASVPPVTFIELYGLVWVTEHIIEVGIMSAVGAFLAVVAAARIKRWSDRRDAKRAARGTLLVTRPDAAPLPPARQRAELPPVVNNYFYVADPVVAARVIRQARPAQAVTFTQLPRGNHDQGTA